MKLHLYILFTLLLVSCTNVASPTVTTLQPSVPHTLTPGLTATQISPSKTPSPTKSPTATPLELPSRYEFPDWMKNPETAILAALTTNDAEHSRKISFFNAVTAESFDMPLPREVGGYFWYDNPNFGLLTEDLKTAYRINLQNGNISSETVSPQATQFLDAEDEYHDILTESASALELTDDEQTNDALFRRNWYAKYGNKSNRGRFTANWSGENNTGITVTDNQAGQVIWESEPFRDSYGTFFLWSPKEESQLAYLQGKTSANSDYITDSIILTVVDVAKGKVLWKYAGDFGKLTWSPDGKKILYQNPMTLYQYSGAELKVAPCILFLESGEKRCLRSIPRFVPEGYQLETTGLYTWSPDNNSIFYTYIFSDHDKKVGKLCVYSLVTSYINCPVDQLDELDGMTVINLDLSPDEQFVHFCYSASSILNDYADTSYDGLIKQDGSGFITWKGAIHAEGPFETCSQNSLWRPLPE